MNPGSTNSLYEEAFQERVNYSDRFGCIFIHIPKAAGTTVAQQLGLPASSHLTFSELTQTAFFRRHSDTPIFAVVRNPIDRFISLYSYARMPISEYHNNLSPEQGLYGPHLDYRLLADADLNQAVDHLLAGRLQHDRRWNQWRPQCHWLLAGGTAIDPRIQLIRMEALAQGLEELLGVPCQQLPHANRSAGTTTLNELSPEVMGKLMGFYKQDYELLPYPTPGTPGPLWLRAKQKAGALLRSAGWRKRCLPGNSPHRY